MPFRSSISKIINTLIENAEDLDIATPMYGLLKCSDNYCMISPRLCNYHRDEIADVNDNTSEGILFYYKTKATGKTLALPYIQLMMLIKNMHRA